MTTMVATTPMRDQKSGLRDDGGVDGGDDGGGGGITDAAMGGTDNGGITGVFISVVGCGGTIGFSIMFPESGGVTTGGSSRVVGSEGFSGVSCGGIYSKNYE